jgi:deazaflavin-dependent oxidoreductase (nitroreductase family)
VTLDPVRRVVFRTPLLLHRLGVRGVERLLGIDWMLLTTIGRRTGRPHEVLVDVIGHDDASGSYYVSPADVRSDWVRNVHARPQVKASVRGRDFRAHVEDVTGPEGARVLLRFIREHAWYARIVMWFVGLVDQVDRSDQELYAQLRTATVFAIRPET